MKKKTEILTPIELVFDGERVFSPWFHPKIAPVLCTLCKEKCNKNKKEKCFNINPYCG